MIESEQNARHHVARISYMHTERPAVFIARQNVRRLTDIAGLEQLGDRSVSEILLLANARPQEKPGT
ncbi:hypothetical protein D3C71_1725460 [compost metagenome]